MEKFLLPRKYPRLRDLWTNYRT